MATQEDNITPGLYGNVWDATTSPCAANEQVSRGAAAILWGPSGVCRTSDYVYAVPSASNVNVATGAPCGSGSYATGGGHRTFDNWSWKEMSGITGSQTW